jgi:hypothetical protein
MGYLLPAVAVLSSIVVAVSASDGVARTGQSGQLVLDVQLAFDTTRTMAPSIAAAERQAEAIVQRVKEVSPGARFSVVAFRDTNYSAPEYELLQRFTEDPVRVQSALGRLRIATSTAASNTSAEAYNLVFRRSYSDPAAGWRPNARKLLVVIGDAEPHGAASGGVTGCRDTTADPHGLRTSLELDRMRVAKRTLVLVRQASRSATASLACYAALAERAFPGGAALDGGAVNLAVQIVDLVRGALVPVRLVADAGVAPGRMTNGYTLTLSNPNSLPLTVDSLVVTLPAGLTYRPGSVTGRLGRPESDGAQLIWKLPAPLSPRQVRRAHFVVVASGVGTRRASARADARLPDGTPIVANSTSSIRIGRPRQLAFAASGRKGATTLQVRATFRSAAGLRSARAVGTATITMAGGRRAVVRLDRYAVQGFATPSRFRLAGRVISVTRLAACRLGTRVALDLVDSNRLLADERTSDRVGFRLTSGCRAINHTWRNTGPAAASVGLSVR